jgi:hypothetical protein
MHFSTFTHVRQTCFAYNFFLCIFVKFFSQIGNQHEILRFILEKIFKVILVLFLNFEAKCTKTAPKIRKHIK